jgi:hypothetical protein
MSRLTDEQIDNTRFLVMERLEKERGIKWGDICGAIGEAGGLDYSIAAEEFLIEITMQTVAETAQAHEPDTNCEAKYCLLGKMEHECNDQMPERITR